MTSSREWQPGRTLPGMAPQSWVTSICTALGVAVGAGAAQLGVGYGLSVITWVPSDEDSSRALWLGSLAWVAWLAANSTAFGALCAERLGQRDLDPERSTAFVVAWRAALALSAAIGALITVPLVAVPARFAQQVDTSAPQFTAGGYAVVGVIVGLVVAFGAINVRAVASNVIASASWLWILAAAAVFKGLNSGSHAGSAQLATWQFPEARWVRGMVNLPGALLMLGAAFIIGVAAAWRAGRRGDHRVGVALSGAVGPTMVAAAYFLAVPGLADGDQQLSAFVTAPYAVLAGLAGSVLVSALGQKGTRERARLAQEAQEAEEHARWQQLMSEESALADAPTTTASTAAAKDTASSPRRSSTAATAKPKTSRARSTRATAKSAPASDLSAAETVNLGEDTRASSRAYVTDTVAPPKAATSSVAPEAEAAPVEPLWPEETTSTARKRKGFRRGSRD